MFLNCKDNHKAWQAFEVFLHGTVLEFIHMFVEEEGITNIDPLGFLKWQSEAESAILKMMFQLVLKFGLGIYVQRIGDRHNDAARFAFRDLFYGFNHPLYQEIEYRDLKNKAIYPEEVKQGLLVFCFVSWYLFIYIAVQLF